MAKKSQIRRNNDRKDLIGKFAAKRQALRLRSKDLTLSLEERMEARAALDLLPANSSATQPRLPAQVRHLPQRPAPARPSGRVAGRDQGQLVIDEDRIGIP
jgi:small subunit ribosomal protein S14